MLQGLRVQDGVKLGRLHIATLMKCMGIEALSRKPNMLKPAPGHKIYPSLLRKRPVARPDQLWAMDITCIPMARGFLSLAAVMGWCTWRVLAWRVSITLEVDVCIEAVKEALACHGTPEIFNSDQGSQFTSTDVIKVLADREIRISMEGKGAWRDNVFVERRWRTIQCEEVDLRACASVSEARPSIGTSIGFYTSRRPPSSPDGKTPDQAYFTQPMLEAVAAEPRRKPLRKRPEPVQTKRNTSNRDWVAFVRQHPRSQLHSALLRSSAAQAITLTLIRKPRPFLSRRRSDPLHSATRFGTSER
jgi:putative transposase